VPRVREEGVRAPALRPRACMPSYVRGIAARARDGHDNAKVRAACDSICDKVCAPRCTIFYMLLPV